MNTSAKSLSVVLPEGESGLSFSRFAHDAMDTTFEILVPDADADGVPQEVFEELDRIEQELSRFVESSDVSRINALEPGESIRVGIATFECLRLAVRLHDETDGAFDITARPGTCGSRIESLVIDEEEHSVSVSGADLRIDLGGIGKGYALDRLAEFLREWGIETALIHAGQSTVLPVGRPVGTVALRHPESEKKILEQISLHGRALSGSGVRIRGDHIVDPRTGRPPIERVASWALAGSAALSDALSTAFLVMEVEQIAAFCQVHPGVAAWIAVREEGACVLRKFGDAGRGVAGAGTTD